MIKSDIPAGYQLNILSWENDGDNYNTETLNGLSEEDVKFYMELLPLFHSGSNYGESFGNIMDDEVDYCAVGTRVLEVYLEHPDVSKDVKDQFEWLKDMKMSDTDGLSDGLHQVMHDLIGSSEFYCFRVFEGAQVFFFETPVKDVTSKFKVKS